MRFIIRQPVQVLIMATLTIAGSGCRTSRQTSPNQLKLFLERTDYDRRIERAVGAVLDEHLFTIPWIVVAGHDSSLWFVSERFHSPTNFERVFVHLTKTDEVRVKIHHREIALSDWHFGDGYRFLPEAEEMKNQIGERLATGSGAAHRAGSRAGSDAAGLRSPTGSEAVAEFDR